MLSKANLRDDVSKRLRVLRDNKEERAERNTSLNRHLTNYLRDKRGVWAGFVALSTEPDIFQSIDDSTHIQWVYPRVVDDNLQFHSCKDRSSFKKSSFGIQEPCETETIMDLNSIDGFIVPGIAFGRDGARLGRGKGYYDRTLSKTTAEKVGVCFSLQLFKQGEVPTESTDVHLNLTISDEGLHKPRPLEER